MLKPNGPMTNEQYRKWLELQGKKEWADKTPAQQGVLDSFGNVIPVERLEAWGKIDAQGATDLMQGKPMHIGPSGKYVAKTDLSENKITLDKETGDISIVAPNYMFENKSEYMADLEDSLKSLSQAYKIDPEAKLPTIDGTDKTVEEIIESLNAEDNESGFNKYVEASIGRHDIEYNMPMGTIDGREVRGERSAYRISDDVVLGDKYYAIRGTVALGDDVKDDTLQAISNLPEVKELFGKLETYKEENGIATAQYKDIMENGWNREKHDDEEIKEARDALENYFANVEVKTEKDAIELAHNIATYEFMTGKKPDVAWLRSVAETTGAFIEGAGVFLGDVGMYVGAGAESALAAGGEMAFKSLEDIVHNRALENNESEWWDIYKEGVDRWEEHKGSRSDDKRLLSGTMAGAEQFGYGLARLATLIFVGNVASAGLSSTLAKVASKVAARPTEAVAGANALAAGVTASATTMDMVYGGLKIMNTLSSASTVAKMASVTSKILASGSKSLVVTAVAETAGEVIVGHPKTFYSVLNSGELSEEDKVVLWSEYAQNVIYGGVGLAATKGLLKLGETDWGRVQSYNMAVSLQKFLAPMRKLKTDFKLKIHGVDSLEEYAKKLRDMATEKKDSNLHLKADIVTMNDALNKAREDIAQSVRIKYGKVGHDKAMKLLEEAEEPLKRLRKLQNAIDSVQKAGRDKLFTWYASGKYREFSGANMAMEGAYESLRRVEEATGFVRTAGNRPGKLAITQDSTNYIFAINMRDYYSKQIELFPGGKNVAEYKKSLKGVEELIADFEGKAPAEVIDAAKKFVEKQRLFNKEAMDLLVKEGILNKNEIAELRASGLWGESGEMYVHAVRVRDDSGMFTSTIDVVRKEMISNPKKYVVGATGDYLDPLLTARRFMMENADVAARQEFAKIYLEISGTKKNVVATVEETELVRKVNDSVNDQANMEVKSLVEDVANSFRASGAAEKATPRSSLKDRLSRAKSKVKLAQKDVKSAMAKSGRGVDKKGGPYYKASTIAKQRYIPTLNADEVNDVWGKVFRSRPVDAIDYAFENYDSLPKTVKEYIANKLEEYRNIVKNDIANGEYVSGFEFAGVRYERVDDFLASQDFRNLDSDGMHDALVAIFGEDDTNRIMERAKELAAGARNADDAKIVGESDFGKKVSELNEDPYSLAKATYDEEYEKYKATKKEIKRFKQLLNTPGSKFTDADNAIYAKWADRTDEELDEIVANAPKKPRKSDYTVRTKKEQTEPVLVQNKKAPTADDVRYAVADMQYSDELNLQESAIRASQDVIPSGKPTVDEVRAMAEYDPEFETGLKKQLLAYHKPLRDNPSVDSIAWKYNKANDRTRRKLKLKTRSEELEALSKDFDMSTEDMNDFIDAELDVMEERLLARPNVSREIDALVAYHDGDEALKVYLGERAIYEHVDEFKAKIIEEIKAEIAKDAEFYGITNPKEQEKIAKRFANEVVDRLKSRMIEHGEALSEVYPWTKNNYKIYGEVRHEAAKIEGLMDDTSNVVPVLNENGEMTLYETDPLVASMLRHDVLPRPMNKWAKLNYLLSRMFRLGTVGTNIRSMVNQTFRDFGNAFVGGNFYRMWAQNVDQMRDVLGDNVVEWIKACDSELANAINEVAEETGQNASDVAYEYIKKSGEAISPQMTETAIYRNAAEVGESVRAGKVSGGIEGFSSSGYSRVKSTFDAVEKKLGKLNEGREVFLRNGVYRNAFTDAVKRGYSYKDAKDFATFAMNNATTNFARLSENFISLQQTIPFLGAAINGTKSFYRLLELDPVGVVGRMVGGVALPTLYMTAYSLHDPKNREIYKNIPEYMKNDNIVFVVDEQVLSIPIPQEISAVIAPFRHLVEKMYDANQHAFWQLAINDVLGLSPIELDGFANIDGNTLKDGTSEDRGFMENIDTGICKMVSQIMPPYAKGAFMMATGIDPYTMNKIDRGNYRTDADMEQAILMDDYSSEFGKQVARLLNKSSLPDYFKMSAPMADKVLGSIMGTAPVEYIGWLIEAGQAVTDGDGISYDEVNKMAQNIGEFAGNPLFVGSDMKSIAHRDWQEAVARLYQRREDILNSDSWKEYQRKYDNAPTLEERAALLPMRENLVAEYYEDIKKTVSNLQKKYPGQYTAAKHASVLNLSTLNLDAHDTTPIGADVSSEQFKAARSMAISTMARMGFDSPSDYSVFGYLRYYEDSNEVSMVASTPMAILDLDRTMSMAGDLHLANIRSILDANDLTKYSDGYKELQAIENELYNKPFDERSDDDYDKVDDAREEWNAKVMERLYPYISRYGIDSVTRNPQVIDELDNVIRVPSWYEVNKKGYHVSLPRANKQRGFAPQYIKDVYNAMSEGRN